MSDPHREETQRFVVQTILTSHCMQVLTPDRVEQITAEIVDEMRNGSCAWAFKPHELRGQARSR